MWVALGVLVRVRHPGLGQQLYRAPSRVAPIGVGPQCLPDLKADLPNRVEIGHRVLGNVADLAAPNGAHHAPVRRGDVTSVENDAASGNSATGGQQPQDGRGRGGLTGSRLSHHRNGLPAINAQIHAGNHGFVGAEPDLQAVHRQQRGRRGAHARHARDAGSRASRNASPIIMKASTVTASAPAG